jgi:subtilisin family serine protease
MALFPSQQEEKFYYAFDKKVPLIPKPNTLLVKYSEETDKEKVKVLLTRLDSEAKIKWHNPLLAEVVCSSEQVKEELKSKLEKKDEIKTCQPFYTSKDGMDMGVADEILVRFLPEVTTEEQNRLHEKFKTKVIKTTKIYQKLVVPKGGDALEIANQYYETGLVKFAHPNFISYPKFNQVIPNDTYFNNQVACHNTGQTFTDGHSGTNDADIDAPEAWGITTGCSDIVIAVLDEGVTSNHPDLPNTRQIRLNGSNFGDGNANDPSPTGNDNHGNACAGVIAATMNNNEGIAGIAPNCRIMPIRIKNALPNSVADAIEFAVNNGANILSNSWSYGSDEYPVVTTAINYAVNNNRVVIFSAGNNADHEDDNNGYVEFPANVNIPYVITVGHPTEMITRPTIVLPVV